MPADLPARRSTFNLRTLLLGCVLAALLLSVYGLASQGAIWALAVSFAITGLMLAAVIYTLVFWVFFGLAQFSSSLWRTSSPQTTRGPAAGFIVPPRASPESEVQP